MNIIIIIKYITHCFRVVERGRTKCAQYWGPEPGDEVQAGGFTVTTLEVDTNPDYTISMLLLTNNKVYISLPIYIARALEIILILVLRSRLPFIW